MAAKITNLLAMKGVGIFAERKAGCDDLSFRQYNLIYGFNGSGKSTLSRLFSSLETGNLHPKLPANCSFDFTLGNKTNFGFPHKMDGLERRLLVFNSDFIESNLKWSQGKANPVFYIGPDQAEAAAKLDAIEKKLPELESRLKITETAVMRAEKSLNAFKRDKARFIGQRLHQTGRKYEAPHLTKDYESWSGEKILPLSDDELTTTEDTLKRAEPMPRLNHIEFGSKRIEQTFQFTREICEQSLSTVALPEIQKFPEMLLWIKNGAEFHDHHALERCLLCGNELGGERLNLLKRALDDQIDQFIAKLDSTTARLQSVTEALDNLKRITPSPDSISAGLRHALRKCRAELLTAIEAPEMHLNQLSLALVEKRRKPANPVDTSKLPHHTTVEEASTLLTNALDALNSVLKQHNLIVSDFALHRDRAATSIRKHFLAECLEEFTNHIETFDIAKKEEADARAAVSQAKTDSEALRQKIKTHGPAATVINKLIASYLGHRELTINPIEEGYELHRHGTAIQGMPSEGEKTAISIAYFLSKIDSDNRKLKNLIIVIDDPVSSLDTRALNYACSLIRNRLSSCCQLFVLTHNQQCLNEFRKAWKKKARPAIGKEPTATFLFIDVTIPKDATRRVSSLVSMPKLLREYDSEYHFLFSHALKFADARHGVSEYGYMMPNVLRRILDIFLAFKCPGGSPLPDKIEEICRHYPDLDRERLGALERLAQVESHSDNLDDLISFSSMTLEETRQATDALLALMFHVDERHTTALKSICV
ncbi:MAG: AAA family ATPase [Proteobacteria bacterium]|nr:AAA family ATPase [Pseudomonadota bacterium]